MIKSALFKDSFREIRKSFGRFLSIFLITAIGCGFFSGIKATMSDMQESAAQYFEENNLMDLRLMSTYGVKSEDVLAVKNTAGVKGVMAGYSKDVIYNDDDETYALKIMSYNTHVEKGSEDDLNRPSLIEGRLPENSGECVVEVKTSSPESFEIGNRIQLSAPSEDEQILDSFVTDEYTIVGIVASPLYIGPNRDSTNIGTGAIASYVMIPEDDFKLNYYYEMYVTLTGLEDYDPFSDEYRAAVEEKSAAIEQAFQDSVNARYEQAVSQAQAEMTRAEEKITGAEEILGKSIAQLQVLQTAAEQQLTQAQEQYERTPTILVKVQITQTQSKLEELKNLIAAKQAGDTSVEENYTAQLESAKQELTQSRETLEELQEPAFYITNRFSITDYTAFDEDSQKIDAIAKIFPVFFIIVAALVCMTAMTRMIDEQRTQAGVYKALGYSSGKIVMKYLVYALIPAILGSAAGAAAGMRWIPQIIYDGYRIMYSMPVLHSPVRMPYFWGCVAVSVALVIGVVVLSVWREMQLRPAELMRPKAPKAGKRVLLERVPFVWNKFSFLAKVTVRNLMRQKKRFLMTVFGVAGCTALILAGFGLRYSIASILDLQYGKIFCYDGAVVVNTGLVEDPTAAAQNIAENDNVENALAVGRVAVNAYTQELDEKQYETSLMIVPDGQDLSIYLNLRAYQTGETMIPDQSGMILTAKLADLLDLKVGDTICLRMTDNRIKEIRVSGIAENYALHFGYVTESFYEQEFGEKNPENMILFNLKDYADKTDFAETVVQDERYLGLSYLSDSVQMFSKSMHSIDTVILMLIIFAGGLAITVLYTLASINITERTREIATLRVLGFSDAETSEYIFRENVVSVVTGILAGWLMGIFLHRFVVTTAEIDLVMFNRALAWHSYLISSVITAGFALLVNFVLHFRIIHTDMVESLKSVE